MVYLIMQDTKEMSFKVGFECLECRLLEQNSKKKDLRMKKRVFV